VTGVPVATGADTPGHRAHLRALISEARRDGDLTTAGRAALELHEFGERDVMPDLLRALRIAEGTERLMMLGAASSYGEAGMTKHRLLVEALPRATRDALREIVAGRAVDAAR